MTLLHRVVSALSWLFRRQHVEQRLDEELRAFLDMSIAEKVRDGMPPADARRLAMLELGGLEQAKERVRAGRHGAWLDEIGRDVRYAFHTFVGNPGFTAFSLVVLATGIGGGIALFGLLDALALRSLPVERPERLVSMTAVSPARTFDPGYLPLPALQALDRRQDAFASMSGYVASGVTTLDDGRPTEHGAVFASEGYFDTLGVRPVVGRLWDPTDVAIDAHVAVISDGYWQRCCDRDPHVVGRTVRLMEIPFTIVGVAPARFSGVELVSAVDFFLPIETVTALFPLPDDFVIPLARGIGRLRDGVSLETARHQLQAVWPAVLEEVVSPTATGVERDEFLGRRLEVAPAARGFSYMRDWYATPLHLLVASTSVLLLAICVNLAGLVWARPLARQREIDTRMALGASPARIARLLLAESLMLTTTGTLIALPVAWTASHALVDMMWIGPAVPPLDLTPGWRVYVVVTATAAIAGTAMALLPVWKTRQRARAGCSSMRSGGRVTSRANDVLVVAQVAVATVLLVGAGLVTTSLATLRDRTGFPTADVHLTRLLPRPGAYDGLDRESYARDLVERTSAVLGVASAALSVPEPLMGLDVGEERLPVTAGDAPEGARVHATIMWVSPGFFETMGVPLVAGRAFTWADDANSRPVAMLSSASAERLFAEGRAGRHLRQGFHLRPLGYGGQDGAQEVRPFRDGADRAWQRDGADRTGQVRPLRGPHAAIGRSVRIGFDPRLQDVEVVGIAADARLADVHTDAPLFVFVPLLQHPFVSPTVIVRTRRHQAALEPMLSDAIEAAGRDFAVAQRTLDAQIDVSLLRERLMALGGRWFGGLAIVLVVAGMAGVLSQHVARRTREIGVRMALGASPATIRTMVLGRTLGLAGLGLLVGLPLAGIAATLVARLLTAVSARDATTFLLAASAILIVSLVAAWAPARRAVRIQPAMALRAE